MAAVAEFTLIGNLLALQTQLRPGNRTQPFRPDLLFAVGAGAVPASLQSAEGVFDLAKPARRAIEVSDGEFARLGRLHLIHGVRRLLDAHFFSQAKALCDLLACILQLFLNLESVALRCHDASPFELL